MMKPQGYNYGEAVDDVAPIDEPGIQFKWRHCPNEEISVISVDVVLR